MTGTLILCYNIDYCAVLLETTMAAEGPSMTFVLSPDEFPIPSYFLEGTAC